MNFDDNPDSRCHAILHNVRYGRERVCCIDEIECIVASQAGFVYGFLVWIGVQKRIRI
jgi:hypothetical protein